MDRSLTFRNINQITLSGIDRIAVNDAKQILIYSATEMNLLWSSDGVVVNNASNIIITGYDKKTNFDIDDENEFTFKKYLDISNVDSIKIDNYISIKKLERKSENIQEVIQLLDNTRIITDTNIILHEINSQYYCCYYFYQKNLSFTVFKFAEKNQYINFIVYCEYDTLNNITHFTIKSVNQTFCAIMANFFKHKCDTDIFDIVFKGKLDYLPIPKINDMHIFNFLESNVKSQIEIERSSFTYTLFVLEFNPLYLETKFLDFIKNSNKDTLLLVFQKKFTDATREYHMILNEKSQTKIESVLQFTILAQNQHILSFTSAKNFEDIFKR